MRITYIGIKPSKADTVAGTGLVWIPGQAHEVAEDAAAKLLKHADVWAVEGNKPEPFVASTEPAFPGTDDTRTVADADAEIKAANAQPDIESLRAQLAAKGIKFHHKAGAEKLAALLSEAA